jgi:hypothetical protein
MANEKVSGLTSGAPVLGADEFFIARGGASYKVTASDLNSFIGGGGGSLASTDLTDISNVAPTQTGELLIFNSVSGEYEPSLNLDGGLF